MTTNNAWNSENPAQVARGGTGRATLTDGAFMLGDGTNAVEMLGPLSKGDLIAGDGTTSPQLLTVGSDDQILVADSNEILGVKWVEQSPTASDILLFDDFMYGIETTSAGYDWGGIWERINNSPAVAVATAGRPGVVECLDSSSYGIRTARGTIKVGTNQLSLEGWV